MCRSFPTTKDDLLPSSIPLDFSTMWGMPNYRRAWIKGGCFFFTASLADRASSLLVDRVEVLGNAFRLAQTARPFRVDAIVVLPDHLHCIWTLPPGDSDFATRWAHIKAEFSRNVPRGERRRESRIAKRERGIWQRRYWEHLIRDERDFAQHVDYVHINPVKHGFVERACDWRWSSIHRHIRSPP